MWRSTIATLAVLLGLAPSPGRAEMCVTPLVPHEPLCSPALSSGAWPISHRGPYAQGSSAFAGPTEGQSLQAEHLNLLGPPITLAMSPAYPDGGTAVWASLLGPSNAVAKIDHDTFTVIDAYVPADEEPTPPPVPLGVSGAYSVADAEFNFIVGRASFIEVFSDATPGDRFSDIVLSKRVFLPPSAFCRPGDLLVGGVMLPDGMLAFVTEQAVVGVIPSALADMEAANVQTLPSENGATCGDPNVPTADLERVSNSMAADEDGGFYVVTDAAVVKYHWDGSSLHKVWRTEYESDPPFSILRLGPGSGSTPSLMGTAHDDDRFVVITDGRELMHLVLLWRDQIPAGWQPIAPGRDPRIACEVPITFGDPDAVRTLSEQSVLVRGYAAVVVNNLLTSEEGIDITGIAALDAALAALEGGDPAVAPRGIERVDWDPEARTCAHRWTNATVSIPNAIPTMSAPTDRIYAIGQRGGAWGLETIDFATGESRGFAPSAAVTCPQEVLDTIATSPLAPFLLPVIAELPASCENSTFAATEVGPDGTIYTGTFQGASKFTPATAPSIALRGQVLTGVAQGEDLVARGLAALGTDSDAASEAAERGATQMEAVLAVLDQAELAGKVDPASAAAARAAVTSARDHFAAAKAAVGIDDGLAASELNAALADLALAFEAVTPCPGAPRSTCRTGGGARLSVVQAARRSDQLKWGLRPEILTLPADFGDPTSVTDYALCLYADGSLVGSLELPAPTSGWSSSKKGLRYDDPSAERDGLRQILLRGSETGRAKLRVRAKGPSLAPVPLPLAAPITVEFVNLETGVCWQNGFDAAEVRQNTDLRLKAKTRS